MAVKKSSTVTIGLCSVPVELLDLRYKEVNSSVTNDLL